MRNLSSLALSKGGSRFIILNGWPIYPNTLLSSRHRQRSVISAVEILGTSSSGRLQPPERQRLIEQVVEHIARIGVAMTEEVSLLRLYVLRCMYLLNCALVGAGVWVQFIHRQSPWDPITGVAFSFWAALAGLSALGIRYPLAMLPLMFMQLFYKTFWVLAVYLPLRSAGRSSDLTQGFLIAIALDIIVIPWAYVVAHYIKKRGDQWR